MLRCSDVCVKLTRGKSLDFIKTDSGGQMMVVRRAFLLILSFCFQLE